MTQTSRQRQYVNAILWALMALYAYSRILQVFPGRASMREVLALHVLPPALFALIHGAVLYRIRGSVTFILICLAVGNIFESLGVLTGFPYGHYYFTGLMGPKFFVVPVFLGLAYVGMAYLSWTLARIILKGIQSTPIGSHVITVPLLAAFIMVAWDLSMDPIWSTVLHAWIWQHGGLCFGVPVSNFFGWYLVVYVIYQLFALYLRNRPINPKPLPSDYWHLPILFYALSAAGNLILAIPHHPISLVSDPTGVQWRLSTIVEACAVVSILVMGTFALTAWARLPKPEASIADCPATIRRE
jgi:uncharacterized membrane protein